MKYHKNNDRNVVLHLYLSISALTAVKMKLYSCMQMLASSQQVGFIYFKFLFSLFQAERNNEKRIIGEAQGIVETQR